MSEIKVNKLSPRSGTAVTLGDSGDTFTIPSGATLAIAGSVTGFTSAGIDDNATEVALIISSDERVTIVSGAPTASSTTLSLKDDAATTTGAKPRLGFQDSANTYLGELAYASGGSSDLYLTNAQNANLLFSTNNTERMRIDNAGNTMFAKSTQGDVNIVGAEIRNNGLGTFTRDGDTVLIANRKSSDGTLLEFRKDNTGFSIIGVNSGNNPFFSGSVANHGGIMFSDAGASQPTMLPMSGGTTLADNSLNLGASSYKYKDLYLGGNLYVGSEIRTNSSASTLSIQGGSTYPGAKIQMAGGQAGSNPGTFIFSTDDGNVTNPSERMRILSSGNIGIGTSTPDAVLQVGALGQSGSVRGAVAIKTIANYTTFGESAIYIEEASGSEGYYMGVDVSGGMFFNNSGAAGSTLYLGDDDNVGIGTSAPQNTLHVTKNAISGASYRTNAPLIIENNSNTEIQILSATSSDGQLRFGDADANFRGAITYSHSDDSFTIATNGASQVKIHSNGVMSAADGIALGVGTANTASNVLSDYEEGTWTPTYRGSSSAGSYSANASGTYTKVGNLVQVTCHLKNITENSAGSGSIQIAGLPFAKSSDQESDIGSIYLNLFVLGSSGSHEYAVVNVNPSVSHVLITAIDSNGGSASTLQLSARVSNSSDMFFSVTYTT